MSHLVVAYRWIILVFGIITLSIINTEKNKKSFLNKFFWQLFCLTLVILQDLIRSYVIASTIPETLLLHYLLNILTYITVHILMYFGIETIHNLLAENNRVINTIIYVILGISVLGVVSPFSIGVDRVVEGDIFLIIFCITKLMFISLFIYMFTIYILNSKKIKFMADKTFGIVMLLTAFLGFSQNVLLLISMFKNSTEVVLPPDGSFIMATSYFALCVYVLYYVKVELINIKPVIDFSKLKSCGFTPREIEVIQHIDNGLTNAKISDKMSVSISTIKSHIYNIYKKTESTDRNNLLDKVKLLLK